MATQNEKMIMNCFYSFVFEESTVRVGDFFCQLMDMGSVFEFEKASKSFIFAPFLLEVFIKARNFKYIAAFRLEIRIYVRILLRTPFR